jgi:ketosteroid isomerase-like protein
VSQENVEVVRAAYEIFADGLNEQTALKAIEAGLLDPDCELDLRTAYPDGPVVRLATFGEFLDTQPWGRSVRFEPESFRAVGSDRVLVFARLHVVGTASGVPLEARVAHLVALRDNQIVRAEVYTDRGKALATAGLSE